MKTNTFEHLESMCASKGIICERRGRKIELTTPDGAITAECASISEALDTYRNDPTYSDLPIQIRTAVASPSPERWEQIQRIKRARERLGFTKTGEIALFHLDLAMKFLKRCTPREWFEIQLIITEEASPKS